MAGIKGRSGRPGGAPENLIPRTTHRAEPLVYRLQVKVARSTFEKVKALPNYPELMRIWIAEGLANLEKSGDRAD